MKFRDSLVVKNDRLGAAPKAFERAGRFRRTPIDWQRLK
jgi:hypothetical protein